MLRLRDYILGRPNVCADRFFVFENVRMAIAAVRRNAKKCNEFRRYNLLV